MTEEQKKKLYEEFEHYFKGFKKDDIKIVPVTECPIENRFQIWYQKKPFDIWDTYKNTFVGYHDDKEWEEEHGNG